MQRGAEFDDLFRLITDVCRKDDSVQNNLTTMSEFYPTG
jgi:hypothetical protein